MGKRLVQQGSSKSAVRLHIVWSLRDLGDHDVGYSLRYQRGYLLVLRMDDDGGMGEVLVCELLVQPSGIDHHTHLRLVDVFQRLEAVLIGHSAQNRLAVGQIAVAHEHGLSTCIGDGDASYGEVEALWLCQYIRCQCRPRGLDKLPADPQPVGNLLRHFDSESPVLSCFGLAERQWSVVARSAENDCSPFFNLGNLAIKRYICEG